uniref:Protein Wnt n=1 Tax=Terebratalia transversa TaxID=34513 RepID=A0AAU7EAS1_TERTR
MYFHIDCTMYTPHILSMMVLIFHLVGESQGRYPYPWFQGIKLQGKTPTAYNKATTEKESVRSNLVVMNSRPTIGGKKAWILMWKKKYKQSRKLQRKINVAIPKSHSTNRNSNDILGLNIPTDPPLDANTVCKTYPLSKEQYRICVKYPDVTASAIQGIQIAIHECQHQFKAHRWNCSTLEFKNKNPQSSALLHKGFRETAFAFAISSAGVTHQVAKACSLGKLRSCGCDNNVYGKTRQFNWGGCSHNIDFGEYFGKRFLNAKEKANDIQARINIHNNRLGRLIVTRHVRRLCKCHGVSGSCELKTCWKAAPEFRYVGVKLKKKYDKALKVDATNNARGKILPVKSTYRSKRSPYTMELIYFEKSPTFCDPDPSVDSSGTTGRICNKTSTGIDRCDTLCCGRGYDMLRVTRIERCHCKFHWCCYVKCKKCESTKWVTVCK